MPKFLTVCKAEPIGHNPAPDDCVVQIVATLPEFPELSDAAAWYTQQAKLIEQALFEALPGGTYDQVAAAMLQRVASHLVVSYGQAEVAHG